MGSYEFAGWTVLFTALDRARWAMLNKTDGMSADPVDWTKLFPA